jgi:hypothetical protein
MSCTSSGGGFTPMNWASSESLSSAMVDGAPLGREQCWLRRQYNCQCLDVLLAAAAGGGLWFGGVRW